MEDTINQSQVEILDTTNRDGAQGAKSPIYGIDSKLEIARALAIANVDRIEAGFPVSSKANFETVRRTAMEVHGPRIFGLATVPIPGTRIGYEGIDKAFEAVQYADSRGIHVFSEMFDEVSLTKIGYTRKQIVEGSVLGVAHARKLLGGRGQVEFSFQNATNCPLEVLVEGYKKMVEAGADVINVPDTVGYKVPEEIRTIISALRQEIPKGVSISIHCHNDLGLATANSLAAVSAGANIIECTINGIGERAGNTSLEEVIMAICTRGDVYKGSIVGFKTEMLNPLSKLVSFHYNMPVQDNKAIVGANAFRHWAGIHQAGMLKGGIYEIIDPKKVGWDGESIELSQQSGYRGVSFRLVRLGYKVSEVDKTRIMPMYKELSDERASVTDTDLVYIMDTINGRGKNGYQFVDMTIKTEGDSGGYTATVVLELNGKIFTAVSRNGESNDEVTKDDHVIRHQHRGAISTLCAAIKKIEGNPKNLHLVKYDPINIGSGEDAPAEVTIILSKQPKFDGRFRPFDDMYVGRARHADTIRASGMAYIDALNKARQ